MSKRVEFKPLSLAQHFEAPKNFQGCFGWICGYSADVGFLEDAIERFTRHTAAQRAHTGKIALAMMLDAGNQAISMVDVPGIAHLPVRNIETTPFRLMHAKVAILGFAHEKDQHLWCLRLIVSTGNWTLGTLEESLDLVWSLDLTSDELENGQDDATRAACTDIKAAWDLMRWLQGHYDMRYLNALPQDRSESESTVAQYRFDLWLQKLAPKARGAKPRFFDNRTKSLLSQLPDKIRDAGVKSAVNSLSMGSGYYETPSDKNKIPVVLQAIKNSLQQEKLLTLNPDIDIFVNPNACQAISNCLGAMNKAGFVVRAASKPNYFGQNSDRALHAKFIFGANSRDNSNTCNSAWLYLGSGNLTGPGFSSKASKAGGNLEAGVVFAPINTYWIAKRGIPIEQVITQRLPIQWETEIESAEHLDAGNDMPDRNAEFLAAPIGWMLWREDGHARSLHATESATCPIDVLYDADRACTEITKGVFAWPRNRPREVRIRWISEGITRISIIPILDEYGRWSATELPAIDLDEAWWQLAAFPTPPDDEDLLSEEDTERDNQALASSTTSDATYPTRQMMQLIENIASKQTSIDKIDWTTWCVRLEQCLTQASKSPVLVEFRELGLNPLSPLQCAPFRPEYADTSDSSEGKLYEEVLRKVEAAWSVEGFKKIGQIG